MQMMTQLSIRNGDILQVKSAAVPLGNFVKIQPQSENFLEITNPRAVLENAFRNFACMTVGDTVSIKYNSKVFDLKVLEAKPANAICIIEADVEVDFAPPPGYVEPGTKKKVPPIPPSSCLCPPPPPLLFAIPLFSRLQQQEEEDRMQVDDNILDDMGFVPFSGGGQSLNGKQKATPASSASGSRAQSPPVASVPSAYARSASPKNASPFGSVSGASPSPRQPSPFNTFAPVVAAPMAVPAGKLVFGKASLGTSPAPSPSSSLTSSLNSSSKPTAPGPSGPTPMGPPATVGGASSGFVAFSGAGRSLK